MTALLIYDLSCDSHKKIFVCSNGKATGPAAGWKRFAGGLGLLIFQRSQRLCLSKCQYIQINARTIFSTSAKHWIFILFAMLQKWMNQFGDILIILDRCTNPLRFLLNSKCIILYKQNKWIYYINSSIVLLPNDLAVFLFHSVDFSQITTGNAPDKFVFLFYYLYLILYIKTKKHNCYAIHKIYIICKVL